MKILVTNHWLKKLGGSETFTYTLIGELIRRNHQVDLYTRINGYVTTKIQKDFKIMNILLNKEIHYDLILANHNTTIADVRANTNNPIIQTCHGVIPKLEQPSPYANLYIAISEEIKNYLFNKYNFNSEIILNGIDCKRFKPFRPINKKIKKVLSLSHSDQLNNKLAKYFYGKRIDFICHNKHSNPKWRIEYAINDVDMVITLGRGAYEAMACGRAVLILDHRPYQNLMGDGIITNDNFHELIKNNCSGRRFQKTNLFTILREAMITYNQKMGNINRQLALEFLNIEKQTDKYLSYYEKIK